MVEVLCDRILRRQPRSQNGDQHEADDNAEPGERNRPVAQIGPDGC